ncbi:SpoIIE family protein phosphatase [Clostridium ganghwense]|uniref:SpoIIE family protein phosphatase n=1 Tax=Clostridium ganghwense TaxID=312089 RepID=A0ABT4CKY7_9CLOT|nr:SpoIIE family protein phosphatase [Clostridium ganghwense]MCY6369603.1 SpoIIE family protein phosphatase [Clostridium ganghwense]
MSLFIDVAYDSLIKHEEELCGDNVEIVKLEDSIIIVMADGLGSGVKANILSTLTTKIAATMLKEGEDIYETVDTIINTLPVCKVRNIAYSTFTILKIYNDGRVFAAEYDNPPLFIIRNSESLKIPKKELDINGKKVYVSDFIARRGDVLTAVSDGVIHAGIGQVLNLGWTWDKVENYLQRSCCKKKSAKNISRDLVEVCWDLYGKKPGDDTTVVGIKIRDPEYIDLFTGPPVNTANDSYVIKKFMNGKGKKIICGGTAANIASRELNREMKVNMDILYKDVPPTSTMQGIDLITEGVLTLSKAVEKLKKGMECYDDGGLIYNIREKDGASLLIKMLLEDCTHLNLWIGKAVNLAHQNPDFPTDLNIKLNLVEELCELMKKLGKKITINYV